MNKTSEEAQFDAIIIGSGAGGATIAKELSKHDKKVLILERGGNARLKETSASIIAMADEVALGDDGLSAVRAITTGGSTSLYFAVVNYPRLEIFRKVGIDLSHEIETVKAELPIVRLPDEIMNPQATLLRESALGLGYSWDKNDMLVDLSKCNSSYSYDAKWKARKFVEDAVDKGATLVNHATVNRILFDKKKAFGVEYKLHKQLIGSETHRAFGTKIILAAGELASPNILRNSGVKGIGDSGFYCNPGYAMYGLVPGLKGFEGFVGSVSGVCDAGIELGDATIPRALHRPMMLFGLKLRHLYSYSNSIGIGIKIKDNMGGELREDGRFWKTFDKEDHAKLTKGKQEAVKILENTGAKHIVDFGITAAGRVGGLVRIQEHLDADLETQWQNLHVCDGSVIPEGMRGTPTFTLVCLGRYLSKRLLSSL